MGKVTISKKGPLSKGDLSFIKRRLVVAGKRMADLGVSTSMSDYASKRKSINPVSFIMNSFGYERKNRNSVNVIFHVFAGGPTGNNPFWTIYVDQGHTLRDKSEWEGYHFVDAGKEAINRIGVSIIKEELSSIKR